MTTTTHAELEYGQAGFQVTHIGKDGVDQINEVLALAKGLEGDELSNALMEYYDKLGAEGLRGVEEIQGWAEGDATQAEPAMTIAATPGVLDLTDAERYRVGMAQTLFVAHALGTVWTREYENDGRPTQNVKPDPNRKELEGSVGSTELWPHNEVLPVNGKIICSKFSTLFGVHNTNSGTPTTLYNAQEAIKQLSPEMVAVLEQPRFDYFGTDLERADGESEASGVKLAVLYPVRDTAGKLLAYDLIADLDWKTMKPAEGDQEASDALMELRNQMMEHEIEYTVMDGTTLVWRNRRALHGRRPVTDPERHLVRSQVGEPEYAHAA